MLSTFWLSSSVGKWSSENFFQFFFFFFLVLGIELVRQALHHWAISPTQVFQILWRPQDFMGSFLRAHKYWWLCFMVTHWKVTNSCRLCLLTEWKIKISSSYTKLRISFFLHRFKLKVTLDLCVRMVFLSLLFILYSSSTKSGRSCVSEMSGLSHCGRYRIPTWMLVTSTHFDFLVISGSQQGKNYGDISWDVWVKGELGMK